MTVDQAQGLIEDVGATMVARKEATAVVAERLAIRNPWRASANTHMARTSSAFDASVRCAFG